MSTVKSSEFALIRTQVIRRHREFSKLNKNIINVFHCKMNQHVNQDTQHWRGTGTAPLATAAEYCIGACTMMRRTCSLASSAHVGLSAAGWLLPLRLRLFVVFSAACCCPLVPHERIRSATFVLPLCRAASSAVSPSAVRTDLCSRTSNETASVNKAWICIIECPHLACMPKGYMHNRVRNGCMHNRVCTVGAYVYDNGCMHNRV